MSERLEMRVDSCLLELIDRARGDVPRATWIKAVLRDRLEPRVRWADAERELVGPRRQGLPLNRTWARPTR